jgi:signal transduction histidine kinase
MSIRLRLTLLYSAIVALTVIAFSAALYVAQSESTLNAIRGELAQQAERFANAPRRPDNRGGDFPPPGSTLPGRWTQLRSVDGTITAHTADLISTTLPLSDAGLRAVQSGSTWSEAALIEEGSVLIYSQPAYYQGGMAGIVQVAAPISEREQSLSNLRFILLIGSSLVIVAAFAIGWALGGTALSPIQRITQTAQAIGVERNFSRRVEHEGPADEVGQLATTINRMLGELEAAYRRQQETLESQRRFVADASHELRTPLTTVRGNIELLRHEPRLDDREITDELADTSDEVERLIRLVNQLLALARADAGQALRREAVAVQPLLEDVCRQVRQSAPQRTISCEATPDSAVVGDRDALRQVFIILLDNALNHTPPGAAIGVSARTADGRATIRITDNGQGIEADVLPHIFERFYRGDISRSGGGAGLGLAIAKDLVEAQGGTLTAESKAGQGTTFTITMQAG